MADGSGELTLTRGRLYDEVWSRPLSAVAADLGLSPNGLAKVCDRVLIPCPPRGYWARKRSGRGPDRPCLNGDPAGPIVFGKGRSASRRRQTRLGPNERRTQMLDAAAGIVLRQGVHAATTRAVARELGISEAQAHKYYQGAEMLIALARRELAAMEDARREQFARSADPTTRVALSTLAYLREASGRGRLIGLLLSKAEVREALAAERDRGRREQLEHVASEIQTPTGSAGDEYDAGVTRVLSALCLRAGRLIAERRLPLPMAERLCLAMVFAGHEDSVERRRARSALAP